MNHVAHIDLIIKTTIRKKNIGLHTTIENNFDVPYK